jgi:uncharacterized membrane protein
LKVGKAERLNRLSTGLTMSYILLLALVSSRLAHQLRRRTEVLRRRARHGTRRTLSPLSLALIVASDPLLLSFLNLIQVLKASLQALGSGQAIRMTISVEFKNIGREKM